MPSCKSVYDPQEDSTMLEKYVRQYAKGRVLDVGTGSGIQSIAAAQNKNVASVLATDIQKGVIDYCKKCIKNRKIRFVQSDLFKSVKGRFSTIIFNPPYLPQELKLRDLTLEGGKKGYEVIERFLSGANEFLETDGIILMVFSSLAKKEKIWEFIKNSLLDFEELEKQHIFFEDIHAYLLRKNEFLKKLENEKISRISYFAKGRRGMLFVGSYKGKKIAIKAKNPKSGAFGRIQNEISWLKRLNKHKIGPKLLLSREDYFAYEFVDGDFIAEYIKKSGKAKIKKVLKDILGQLLILDTLKVDKEEMHHPVKHIIVSKDKPCLIDFERCRYSQHPKNITQFCQFLMNIENMLKPKGISINKDEIMELAKVYKNNQSKANFRKIADLI